MQPFGHNNVGRKLEGEPLPRGATTFSKLGVQFIGLGYCTEQNTDQYTQFRALQSAENGGGAVPLCWKGSWSPSNAMWPWAEVYLHAKFHLDRPTVWPPTLQTGQTGRRFDSIGRTVLQTVAQKVWL